MALEGCKYIFLNNNNAVIIYKKGAQLSLIDSKTHLYSNLPAKVAQLSLVHWVWVTQLYVIG